jgi:hypothetical protein
VLCGNLRLPLANSLKKRALRKKSYQNGGIFDSEGELVHLTELPSLAQQASRMVKPTLRTKAIGTKVTAEEYSRLEQAAQAGAKILGEWCREVMLASVNGRPTESQKSGGVEFQALMAELMALRTILLNVIYKHANGEKLSAEEMQRLTDERTPTRSRKPWNACVSLQSQTQSDWPVLPTRVS